MIKLYNDECYYGDLGTYTGYRDLHVGDVIFATEKVGGESANLIVVYDNRLERFSTLGLLAYNINEIEEIYTFKKVLNYTEINNENINTVTYTDGFSLK